MADPIIRTIESIATYIEQVEGTLILIAVVDDQVIREQAIEALKARLPSDIQIKRFTYDDEHLSLLEGAIDVVQNHDGHSVISVSGLEDLPVDKRTEAIRLLNIQRNRLGRTDLAILLWVDKSALNDISHLAADFYSWRSKTFFIELPLKRDSLEEDRRNYLRAILKRNEFIYLQGLAPMRGGTIVQMSVDDIFIPLYMESKEQLLPEVLNLSFEQDDFFLSKQSKESAKTVDVSELLAADRAVVLGDPGSGKTTLLRYVSYELAKAYIFGDDKANTHSIKEVDKYLPIYIRLGEYAQHLRTNPEGELSTYALISCKARDIPLTTELLQDVTTSDRALFLLDGLDEIIDTEFRQHILTHVEKLALRYTKCKIIVTSRIVSFRDAQLNDSFYRFVIRPLQDKEISLFCQAWYAALGKPEAANTLLHAINQNVSIHRLATNPLLLTVIALIHWRGSQLPHHRAKLYRLAAETLVDQWMSHRRVTPEGWDVEGTINDLLPAIGWHLHHTTSSGLIGEQELHHLLVESLRQQRPRISDSQAHSIASQFRRNVNEFSGIFLERGVDKKGRSIYGFLHLTFEEYFAATRLAEKWQYEGPKIIHAVIHNPRWGEILLLAAGYLAEFSPFQATKFVESLLSTKSKYENILHRDLLLAVQCLADDVRIEFSLQEKIISNLISVYFAPISSQHLKFDILPLFRQLMSTVARQEIADVIHLHLQHSNWRIRASAIAALRWMYFRTAPPNIINTVINLLDDQYAEVRANAGYALAYICPLENEEQIIPLLFKQLHDSNRLVATTASFTLAALTTDVHGKILDDLLELTSDSKPMVRRVAARTLGNLGKIAANETVVSTLTGLLVDKNITVRVSAKHALGRLSKETNLKNLPIELLKMLHTPRTDVRYTVATTFGEIDKSLVTSDLLNSLLSLLRTSEYGLRLYVLEALVSLGKAAATPETISALSDLLDSPELRLQHDAVRALSHMGENAITPEIISKIVNLQSHPDETVRGAVAESLGHIGKTLPRRSLISILLKLLSDQEKSVQQEALNSVKDVGVIVASPKLISTLISMLSVDDAEIIASAALALGEMGQAAANLQVMSALVELTSSPQKSVRTTASESIINLTAHVPHSRRHNVEELLLPLASSRRVEQLDTCYVGLQNLVG